MMAASQRSALDSIAREFICDGINNLAMGRNHTYYQGALDVIREFWAGADGSIDETAQRLGTELALV